MGNKFDLTRELIGEKLNFPKEIVLDIPRLIVIGNNEILIENHKGIIFFYDEEVKINSNIGPIAIRGSGFEIEYIGGSTIVLRGKFKSIEYDFYD